jgi:hypothetical protein
MSKCCQHDTHNFKVCVGLTSISIKETQFILQKIFTWTKKKEGVIRMAQRYWHAPTKVQTRNEDFKSFCSNRFWNSNTPLLFAMECNNHWHLKAMCQIHKFGF